jgi:succinate-semialdehyde dehydrogenase/glutarate-semialdehyde dehydrogenase
VMTVPNEKTAIAVANDTRYGLGGSVYTRDIERGRRVADQIDAGMVFVNHPPWTYEDMPFGGIKKSGYGRETGPLGIREFVNRKLFRRPQSS